MRLLELRITMEAFGTEHKHEIMALEDEGFRPREIVQNFVKVTLKNLALTYHERSGDAYCW